MKKIYFVIFLFCLTLNTNAQDRKQELSDELNQQFKSATLYGQSIQIDKYGSVTCLWKRQTLQYTWKFNISDLNSMKIVKDDDSSINLSFVCKGICINQTIYNTVKKQDSSVMQEWASFFLNSETLSNKILSRLVELQTLNK